MSGLKRPYSNDEGEGDNFDDISTATVRRKLEWATGSCTSPWETASPGSASDSWRYRNDNNPLSESSPTHSLFSLGSRELLDAPCPGENTGKLEDSTSIKDWSDSVEDLCESEICFGMLVDAQLRVWKRSTISHIRSLKSKAPVILAPRFRIDGVTVLHPTLQEIGVLDTKTANGISLLKKSTSPFRLEIYTVPGTEQSRDRRATLEVPLEILIYGQRSSLDFFGSLLSQSNLFLQEPAQHCLSVPYRNPHVISWDDHLDSSYLLGPSLEGHIDLTTEVNAILDDQSVIPTLSFEVEQDARIQTALQPHQLIALKFMIAREECLNNDGFSLWKPLHRSGRYLFENQITGSSQAARPTECLGGILADEMGMGKSLSVLALVLYTSISRASHDLGNEYPRRQTKSSASRATLIICPKSTISNWKQQISKHIQSDALKILIYHGHSRNISCERLSELDIVLTTYETATSDASISGNLSRVSWLRIVLDEAHMIRNRSTKAFQEITKLRAERRWCLTGTPVQNKLSDLFSLTEFLDFYPLDTYTNARKYILEPLSRNDPQGLENLRLALQAISLRRTKRACTSRPRLDKLETITLNKREKELYMRTREQARKLAALSTGKAQGNIVLRAISTLRQICSHGGAALPESVTCDKCERLIRDYEGSQKPFHGTCGHSVCYECILQQNSAEGSALNDMSDICWICEEPVMPVIEIVQVGEDDNFSDRLMDWEPALLTPLTKYSSKIEKVVSNLRDIRNTLPVGRLDPVKSLVFSHWKQTMDHLGAALTSQGMEYVRVDGSLTLEQRSTAMDAFQNVPDIRIMLLSYGCGSVGLNLEVASHVHLLEPHWNPMVEAQAAARVDRLNQEKDIIIYRYIVKDSIEENIKNTQRRKLYDVELSISSMATGEDSNAGGNAMLRNLL